jgi:hypothetical protein
MKIGKEHTPLVLYMPGDAIPSFNVTVQWPGDAIPSLNLTFCARGCVPHDCFSLLLAFDLVCMSLAVNVHVADQMSSSS